MGHLVTSAGVKADPEKVSTIRQLIKPTNVTELKRFVGMCTYLSKFIPMFSEMTAPLRELEKKDVVFSWTEKHDETYKKIVDTIEKDTLLRYYDVNQPVVLEVDASSYAVGAALMQNGKPVCFASQALSPSQQNYHQIEREALAVVYGCKRFHAYVYGADLTVETDHQPLESIFKKPMIDCPMRLQSMFADLLSRDTLSPEHVKTPNSVVISRLIISDPMKEKLLNAYGNDSELAQVKSFVKSGWSKRNGNLRPNLKKYSSFCDEITIEGDFLYKGLRLIVPKELRQLYSSMLHSGHLEINRTLSLAHDSVYWPGITKDIKALVYSCESCQFAERNNQKEPVFKVPAASLPWEKLHADLFEFNSENVLVLVDDYSGFFEVSKVQNTTSLCIITEFWKQFSRHGIPQFVVTDNGRQFVSDDFASFAKETGFSHKTSSPFHPEANGLAKRTVQTMKQMLKKCQHDRTNPYLALLKFRTTRRDSHIPSSAERLFSRKLRTEVPIDSQYLKPKIQKNVKENLESERQRLNVYKDFNRKHLLDLQEGQTVRVRFGKFWKLGVIVQKDPNPRSYHIRIGNSIYKKNRHLIRCHETPLETTEPRRGQVDPALGHFQTVRQSKRDLLGLVAMVA